MSDADAFAAKALASGSTARADAFKSSAKVAFMAIKQASVKMTLEKRKVFDRAHGFRADFSLRNF
jgi:hypothetical protein